MYLIYSVCQPISYFILYMIYIHFGNFADLKRFLDFGFHVLSIIIHLSIFLRERWRGEEAKVMQVVILSAWKGRRKRIRDEVKQKSFIFTACQISMKKWFVNQRRKQVIPLPLEKTLLSAQRETKNNKTFILIQFNWVYFPISFTALDRRAHETGIQLNAIEWIIKAFFRESSYQAVFACR